MSDRTRTAEPVRYDVSGTPPVGVRPVGVPPVGVPPVGVLPVGVPPVAVLPVGVPPVAVQPVGVPPVGVAPVEIPPVEIPPVEIPPVGVAPVGVLPVGVLPAGVASIGVRPRRGGRSAARLALVLVLLVGGAATGCGGRATTHHKPGTSHEQATGGVGTLLDAQDPTGHRLREVPADGAPEVQLAARPDSEDGWNLQLTVKNFRFTPDSTGGAALPGAGHAHLELDGRKLARLYGPWFHLPAEQVPEGVHTLTVRLYADDHTAWAVAGKAVEGAAQLTAAAPGQAGHSHTPPSPPTPSSQAQADRTVTLTIRDGKVTPAPGRTELRRGERVALRVTSDRADTLHVHGYDKELALPAGQEATLVLTADRTGLFEVETHESRLVLTQLLVR